MTIYEYYTNNHIQKLKKTETLVFIKFLVKCNTKILKYSITNI